MDEGYACLALKRVELANNDPSVQGYAGGVFWERNTLNAQPKEVVEEPDEQPAVFEKPPPYRVRPVRKS